MKKIILFLLIALVSLSWAQPKKKVQWNDLQEAVKDSIRESSSNIDVIRNELGDTISVYLTVFANDSLTASNGIVYSGRNFGQVILKDTTTLKAYSVDSLGTTVYLDQLSSANSYGGGQFFYDVDGGANDPDHVTSFAVSGTRVWRRIEKGVVRAEWAGVVPDGATDNAAALERAETVARSLSLPLELPSGTMLVNSTWTVSNSQQNDGIQIRGKGFNQSLLKGPGTGIRILQVGAGLAVRTVAVSLQDFSIISTGDQSSDTLIYADVTGVLGMDRIQLGVQGSSGSVGLYSFRSDRALLNQVESSYNTKGMQFLTNVNGVVFNSCAAGNGDSIGVEINSSNGVVWIGGEGGNTDIMFKLENIGRMAVMGGNFESCDSTFFIIVGGHGGSEVTLSNKARFLNGTSSGLLANIGGGSTLNLEDINYDGLNPSYQIRKGSGSVFFKEKLHGGNPPLVFDTNNNQILRALPFRMVWDNGTVTADSTWRGQMRLQFGRLNVGGLYDDRLYVSQRIVDAAGNTAEYKNNILYNNDLRISTNGGGSYGTQAALIEYYGRHTITTAAAAYTIDTVYTDSANGTGALQYFSANIYTAGNAGIDDLTVQMLDYTASTGLARFQIWHSSDVGGGVSIVVHYSLRVAGKVENY